MSHYLFAHFIGEKKNGEQVYFSVSEDGLHWKDLNKGLPVLCSNIGESGVRDPFIVKNKNTGIYYLIATDLCIHDNPDWKAAVEQGSSDLIIWESSDLINWSDEWSCNVRIPGAGCAWAPEAIYDEKEKALFVFWATWRSSEGKHRIYGAYTEDFRSISKPELYIEREKGVIDTTIVKSGDYYYRFTKDEDSARIIYERGKSLKGEFVEIPNTPLANMKGLEGPECYPFQDGRWCLVCDQFAAKKGYLPIIINDLETGAMEFLKESDYNLGQTRKRHGGIIEISEDEYQQLLRHYGLLEGVVK
ncbi:MAG TPA: glycoside hydrolase family 43 protein [Candidatus Pelethocola excrementipullorum]|nr:glycoside hydrolase family 43 protein [Candidatus Pelethocola excrementipullorum]